MNISGTAIYDRIVKMLEIRNVKANDFYKKVGITRQNLSKWKAGSLPSIDVLYSIKETLDVSLEWLLTGENNQDGLDPTASYRIVDRIDDTIKRTKKFQGNWEAGFYDCIKDIVKPYELNDWVQGYNRIDISKVKQIADRLGESVQYIVTGSHISKAEYTEKYFGNKETEEANFYRTFSCLSKENKDTLKHLAELYFNEQIGKNEKK